MNGIRFKYFLFLDSVQESGSVKQGKTVHYSWQKSKAQLSLWFKFAIVCYGPCKMHDQDNKIRPVAFKSASLLAKLFTLAALLLDTAWLYLHGRPRFPLLKWFITTLLLLYLTYKWHGIVGVLLLLKCSKYNVYLVVFSLVCIWYLRFILLFIFASCVAVLLYLTMFEDLFILVQIYSLLKA